jgi:hypothetical protein
VVSHNYDTFATMAFYCLSNRIHLVYGTLYMDQDFEASRVGITTNSVSHGRHGSGAWFVLFLF